MKNVRFYSLLAGGVVLPPLIVGLLSGGPNAARVLQGGLVALVGAGIGLAIVWARRRSEPDTDEREDFLLLRALAFGFYATWIAVTVFFMWPFKSLQQSSDASLWLLAVMAASFMTAYVYNRARH